VTTSLRSSYREGCGFLGERDVSIILKDPFLTRYATLDIHHIQCTTHFTRALSFPGPVLHSMRSIVTLA
jgi:hypothetical protein